MLGMKMADCINTIKRVISFQILRSRNDSVLTLTLTPLTLVRDLDFNRVKNLRFFLSLVV